MRRIEHDALNQPTLRPRNRYSTIMDGIAGGERRHIPPVEPPTRGREQTKQEAPSPEDQRQRAGGKEFNINMTKI